jgi:hypothetical protein
MSRQQKKTKDHDAQAIDPSQRPERAWQRARQLVGGQQPARKTIRIVDVRLSEQAGAEDQGADGQNQDAQVMDPSL